MVRNSPERSDGRAGTRRAPARNLRFDDPDELTAALQPTVPGIRTRASKPSGFLARIRPWSFGGMSFFTYATKNGSAVFAEGPPCGAVTIPLVSSFGVRVGARRWDVRHGWIHVLPPGVRAEIEPRNGAHLLGFDLDWATFVKHQRAATGTWSSRRPSPDMQLSTHSEGGRRFLAYLDRLCREVNRSGSLLQDPRVAREVADTIGVLLAEVTSAGLESRGGRVAEAVTRQAEEFLAQNLESPVSLSDAVILVGTSTRSLLRAFQKRRGTSPMAFRRRRRFEAARRDLFLADPGETSVTMIAGRYCFDHLGRFAGDYRALFGESPSDTLRR